ncbi:hypothetical protein [Roseisalinus antarcticus]|uniref:Uncharacterized protein n=1 Tax=Roseisalinus antarcticus TaxID=254357 RepID=A0A1Y5RCC9_9RHOB|nr:hypothetical protein [Roseisalinus antarcticus]SLN14176.1 hypothetical protein ROA7023_00120 [Roseisalinus antarcticus]
MDHIITDAAQIRQFVLTERARCVSEREWIHRLAGYGYAVRNTGTTQVVASLLHDREICAL